MPKVSVILTSFNHAQFLEQAIDSVLHQTFSDYELIIWDDQLDSRFFPVFFAKSGPS